MAEFFDSLIFAIFYALMIPVGMIVIAVISFYFQKYRDRNDRIDYLTDDSLDDISEIIYKIENGNKKVFIVFKKDNIYTTLQIDARSIIKYKNKHDFRSSTLRIESLIGVGRMDRKEI